MAIIEIILIISLVLVFWDFMQLRNVKRGKKLNDQIPGTLIANAALIVGYIQILYGYLTNDFRYEEVFSYSASGLNMAERLYSSWASSGSSWLFMSSLFAVGYLFFRLKYKDDDLKPKVFEVMDIMLLFFILVILIQNPFKLLAEVPPDGRGLNPLLKTPWMLIHPPIVFIGYVLVLYAYAFSFESFDNYGRRKPNMPDPENWKLVRGITGLGWLFLTLGIGLGGIWAYEVLGWGGYWAWDPVETASLIPWIILTAYYHLTRNSTRNSTAQQFMLMVSAALVIFATALTRGGLAVSVHAFGSNPLGYLLLFMMTVMIVYFVNDQQRTGVPLFEFNIDTESVYNSAMSLSFISLIMITLVCIWGLAFPIFNSAVSGNEVSMEPEFFNKWVYPFVLLFVASLIGCHLHDKINMKQYGSITGGLLGLGLVAAFLGYPTPNMLANLGIPITIFALGAIGYSIVTALISERRSMNLISRRIIHFGVVMVVLGVVWGAPIETDYGDIIVTPGSTLDLGLVTVEFGEVEIMEPFGNIYDFDNPTAFYTPEAAGFSMSVTVTSGGTEVTGDMKILLYTIYGVVTRPLVLRTVGSDVYLVIHQTQSIYNALDHTLRGMAFAPSEIAVSIMVFPLMNLVWVGVLLMSLGIIVPIAVALTPVKKTPKD